MLPFSAASRKAASEGSDVISDTFLVQWQVGLPSGHYYLLGCIASNVSQLRQVPPLFPPPPSPPLYLPRPQPSTAPGVPPPSPPPPVSASPPALPPWPSFSTASHSAFICIRTTGMDACWGFKVLSSWTFHPLKACSCPRRQPHNRDLVDYTRSRWRRLWSLWAWPYGCWLNFLSRNH